MSLIFIDTETNKVPQRNDAPISDIDNWPSITQLAWIICDTNGTILKKENFTTSLNFTSPNSQVYHPAIYNPIHEIIPMLKADLASCIVVIGHNIEFDINVIGCEFYRLGFDTSVIMHMSNFCTMKETVDYCNFSYQGTHRYPKLQELYTKLFAHPFENSHDAYCDILATYDSFWELVKIGVFKKDEQLFLLSEQEKRDLGYKYRLAAYNSFRQKDKIDNFTIGANIGDDECQKQLGLYYLRNKNKAMAFKWFKIAADNGNADCYLRVADMVENNDLKKQYYDKWYNTMIQEIEDGQSTAYLSLSMAYRNGSNGIYKNIEKAESILKKGIEKGDSFLSGSLSSLLLEKKKYPEYFKQLMIFHEYYKKNQARHRREWYDDRNYASHLEEIGVAYYKGYGTEVNYVLAKSYFLNSIKVYNEDSKISYRYLGEIYELGLEGTSVDYRKSYDFYYEASKRGCHKSTCKIGSFMYYGKGVKRNTGLSIKLLEKARNKGVSEASELLKFISKRRLNKTRKIFWFIIIILMVIAAIIYYFKLWGVLDIR